MLSEGNARGVLSLCIRLKKWTKSVEFALRRVEEATLLSRHNHKNADGREQGAYVNSVLGEEVAGLRA